MSETFRVRLVGVKDGFPPDQVVAALADLFKRPEADVRKMLAGKRVVVKNRLDMMSARKYRLALEQRGCTCLIEPDSVASDASRASAISTSKPAVPLHRSDEGGNASGNAYPVMDIPLDGPGNAPPPVRQSGAIQSTSSEAFPSVDIALEMSPSTSEPPSWQRGDPPSISTDVPPVADSAPWKAEKPPEPPGRKSGELQITPAKPPSVDVVQQIAGGGFQCPRCEYRRLPTDIAPDYQCPKCGVIYAKVGGADAAPAEAIFSPKSVSAQLEEIRHQKEAVRMQYLKHESALRSVGYLYYLALCAIPVGIVAAVMTAPSGSSGGGGALVILVLFMLVVGLPIFLLARGIRNLSRWACIIAGVFAVLGVLGGLINPKNGALGTVLNAYIAWLVFSGKGMFVTSREYHSVVEATPHIKPTLGLLTWLLLAFVVLLVLALGVTMLHKP